MLGLGLAKLLVVAILVLCSSVGGQHHGAGWEDICHKGKDKTIPSSALKGHLGHGDYWGKCKVPTPAKTATPTAVPTTVPATPTVPVATVEPTTILTQEPEPTEVPPTPTQVPPTEAPTEPPTPTVAPSTQVPPTQPPAPTVAPTQSQPGVTPTTTVTV